MSKFYIFIFTIIFLGGSFISNCQDLSFIVLGDLHYDRLDDHNLDYVRSRPQDFKQIFNEYPQYTAFVIPHFLRLIKKQSEIMSPNVKGVVQLGDLVEGVSGNAVLARKMDREIVDSLHHTHLSVPWILVKGNHDVSNSPGQSEAWEEVVRPFIEEQVGKEINHGMYTYKLSNDVELFVLDQFFSKDRMVPESDMISFLDSSLNKSTAKYKFVLTHQPVIPVTQRCWHVLSGIRRPVKDPTLRTRFLNLLAKNKVIVLCAHLHEYSVLSRSTSFGDVVQVMVNSVNRTIDSVKPKNVVMKFQGAGFVNEDSTWQPGTKNIRRKILDEEQRHIKTFKRMDLPGYASISIIESKKQVILSYYNGLSSTPFEKINLTALQEK